MIAGALAACCGTAVAAGIDARTGLIPDRVVLATTAAAFVCAAASGHVVLALAGAAACGGALGALYLLTRGRGLGLGDVKLAAALGCGLGPLAGTLALGFAFVAGGAYGAALLICGRATRRTEIRFGPFLAGGTLLAALGWSMS